MLVIENERSVIKVGKNEHCKAKRWFKFKIELRKKVENLQKITLVLLFRIFQEQCTWNFCDLTVDYLKTYVHRIIGQGEYGLWWLGQWSTYLPLNINSQVRALLDCFHNFLGI